MGTEYDGSFYKDFWEYKPGSPVSNDFNSDGKPDILWRNSATGQNVVWYIDGVTKTGAAWIDTLTNTSWTIMGR